MGSWNLAEFEDFVFRCLHFHSGVCIFVLPFSHPQVPPSQPIHTTNTKKMSQAAIVAPRATTKEQPNFRSSNCSPSPIKTNQPNVQTEQETQ
jgi:hypothetical protein